MPLPAEDVDLVAAIVGTPPGGVDEPEKGPAQGAASGQQPKTEEKPPVKEESGEVDPEVQALLDIEEEETGEEESASPDSEDDPGAALSQADLDRLSMIFGLDKEELIVQDGQLRIRTKIDGEVGEATILDLRKGYQKDSSLTRKQQEFQRQRDEWQKAQETQKQQLMETARVLTTVAQKDFEALREKAKSTNWEELRRADPAEYSAQIAELQHRENEIKQRYSEASQFLQQQQQEHMEKARKWQEEVVSTEHQKLRESLGWKDDKAAAAGGAQIEAYLTSQAGFNPQELAGFVDHRAAVIADKARRYDLIQAKLANVKPKVEKVKDKVKAPGGGSKVGRPINLAEMQKRAKGSGRMDSLETLSYLLAASKKAQ